VGVVAFDLGFEFGDGQERTGTGTALVGIEIDPHVDDVQATVVLVNDALDSRAKPRTDREIRETSDATTRSTSPVSTASMRSR